MKAEKKQNKQESGSGRSTPFFNRLRIFPKLTVNAPNDQYEQEADAMADRVVQMQNEPTPIAPSAQPNLQRACARCEDESVQRTPLMRAGGESGIEASPELGQQLQRTKGSGQALPEATQAQMGQAFGTDFSGVRVHTGDSAAQMNDSIQAKAFTHGSDVYFNKGQYQPGSRGGDRLLAHELTHVVQQGADNRTPQVQRSTGGAVAGGIIGGLFGGAMGTGIGFALGGVGGAIAGGIIGGLLGTAVGIVAGDSASAGERELTGEEITELQKVFGGSLNYSDIRVSFNAPIMTAGGYARTPNNTVYFTADVLEEANNETEWYYSYLVHEVTHAWQHQHGISLGAKLVTAMGGKSNYDYGGQAGLEAAIAEGKHFGDFNTEQQGDICSDYYDILVGRYADGSADKAVWEYFIEEVQAGQVLRSEGSPTDIAPNEAII